MTVSCYVRLTRVLAASLVCWLASSESLAQEQQQVLGRWWSGEITTDGSTAPIQMDLRLEEGQARIFLPERGFYDLPLKITKASGSELRLDGEPFGRMRISVALSTGTLQGRYSGEGVANGQLTLRPSASPRASLKEEEVTFQGAGITLEGTLLLPGGRGPHPVIVWVHGSGSAGLRTNAIYRSPAWYLASHGVAALLYDKRGYGTNSGRPDWDFDELADDAGGALRYLREREDIDADRIGIGGISQAGWVAPLAASRDDGFRFIVALSPAGITVADQNVFSLAGLLDDAGLSPERRAAICDALHNANEFYRTGERREAVERELTQLRKRDWFKDFGYLPTPPLGKKPNAELATMFLDPGELWQEIDIPVLAIWGSADGIVPPVVSRDILAGSIPASTLERSELHILDGANHIFVNTLESSGGFPRIHGELNAILLDWTRKVLHLN